VEPARRLLPRRLQLQRALHAQLLRRRRLRRLAGEVVLLLLQILRLVERGCLRRRSVSRRLLLRLGNLLRLRRRRLQPLTLLEQLLVQRRTIARLGGRLEAHLLEDGKVLRPERDLDGLGLGGRAGRPLAAFPFLFLDEHREGVHLLL